MFKLRKVNKAFDTAFILILLSLFALTVLMTVIFSANAYQNINKNANESFNHASPLFYIASKVRQSDAIDAIRIEKKDETEALVLKSIIDNEVYETWIYNYEGFIYEIYIDENDDFSLSDGIAIYENSKLEFFINENESLTIYNYGLSEEAMKLTLSFRRSRN